MLQVISRYLIMLLGVVELASLIAKETKTTKDDVVVEKVKQVIDHLNLK